MKYAPVFPGMYDQAAPVASSSVGDILARVEASAEQQTPGFDAAAARFIVDYLRAHGATCGEIMTDAAKQDGIVPVNDKHFGPVYARLARAGRIRKCGHAPRTKGHGSGFAPIWEIAQ